jgi:hypothetical protein
MVKRLSLISAMQGVLLSRTRTKHCELGVLGMVQLKLPLVAETELLITVHELPASIEYSIVTNELVPLATQVICCVEGFPTCQLSPPLGAVTRTAALIVKTALLWSIMVIL